MTINPNNTTAACSGGDELTPSRAEVIAALKAAYRNFMATGADRESDERYEDMADSVRNLYAADLRAQASAPRSASAGDGPFMWVCLVTPKGEHEEPHIRAWTTRAERADRFKEEGLEMRALYSAPPTIRIDRGVADLERVFTDACDEAGCPYDNEALLKAIAGLKARTAISENTTELRKQIIKIIEENMLDAWNDICSDTNCHPLDIRQLGGRKLEFHSAHWSQFTAEGSADAVLTLTKGTEPGAVTDGREEVVWLREVDAGTDNACWVISNRVDPTAVPFFAGVASR